jgi:CBS domain-containing membrane protein
MSPSGSFAIYALMSSEVACVEPRQSLAAATAVMSARKIRHLPVVHEGTLVGLLSHRDLPAPRPSDLEHGDEGGISELELREPVARAMTRRVFAVAPDTPALEVAGSLAQRHIGCAPVVDRAGHVLGIVTETDFLDLVVRALHEYPPVAVSTFMTLDPLTTAADRPLAEAEAEMIRRRVRHMPVVDDDERLIGLVTHRDVLRWRSSVLEAGDAIQPDLLVRDAMSRSVVCVTPATTAETAARLMQGQGFGCLPVVDGDRLIGIVTATYFLEQLAGAPGANQTDRPSPILRVRDYMSSSVQTVAPGDPLAAGAEPLSRDETSCLLVMDHDDIAGLVTRTDLVDEAGPSGATLLPSDPAEKVASRMTRGVVQVEADAPLSAACRAMIEREVHQLVVVEDGAPIGILSRWDVIAAARDLRLDVPLGAFANQVAFTLGCEESLGTARAFLEAADVSNILIMDGRFPVGAFGKREAIQARDASPDSAVGGAMSRAILVLPADTPLHHAAAQMLATGAHLVTVLRDGPEGGVLTATDFTEALARLAA